MFKKIIFLALPLAIVFLAVSFLIVPTSQLLEVSANSFYRNHLVRAPAFFYLRHFRELKAHSRDTRGPPLHLVVAECSFTDDPFCPKVLKWLLDAGENVNEYDNSALGFTALHWSAYRCDVLSAESLISKGADLSSQATGEKLQGKTPLEVLNIMAKATCSDSKSKELMENMLTIKADQ